MNKLLNLFRRSRPESSYQDPAASSDAARLKHALMSAEDARQKSDLSSSVTHLDDAIAILKQADTHNALRAACLLNRGICLMELAAHAEAERSFHAALELFERLKEVDLEHNVCRMELALSQLAQGELTAAESNFRAAAPHFARLGDGLPKAVFYENLGSLYTHSDRPAEARTALTTALEVFSRISADPKQHAGCLLLSGNLYRHLNNLGAAERDYESAIRLLKRTANPFPELARCWLGLGNVYLDRRQADKAEPTIRKALDSLEDVGNDFDVALGRMNLGAALIQTDRHQDAIDPLTKALEYFARFGPKTYEAMCEANLGIAYTEAENTIHATYHLQRALVQLQKNVGMEAEQANCLVALSVNHDRLGDISASNDAARRALSLCTEHASMDDVRRTCQRILRKQDASLKEELSGDAFSKRLNGDPSFHAEFRRNPVKLAAAHGLSALDALTVAETFNPENSQDMMAIKALLKSVADMGNKE